MEESAVALKQERNLFSCIIISMGRQGMPCHSVLASGTAAPNLGSFAKSLVELSSVGNYVGGSDV